MDVRDTVCLVCTTCYESIVLKRSVGVDVTVWLLRVLAAVCQLVVLYVMRYERWRAWRQHVLFLSSTVWCCTFIINNFLQGSFLHVYGLSVSSSPSPLSLCSARCTCLGRPVRPSLSLAVLAVHGRRLDRSVNPVILFHLSGSCLFPGLVVQHRVPRPLLLPPLPPPR